MVALTKKSKRLIIIGAVLALALMVIIPYTVNAINSPTATSSNNDPLQAGRTLYARGVAIQKIDDRNVTSPANFTLALVRTEKGSILTKFNVEGGKIVVDGTTYTITGGNGTVIRDAETFLLQAQGISSANQAVTMKLEGRFFWMYGHLYVCRIAGSLQFDNADAKELLLLRGAIRV